MSDPDKLVDVAWTRTEIEASTIVEALRSQGIAANSFGGGLAGFRAETPSMVRVVVRDADLKRAKLALAAIHADSVDLDWDEVDVGQSDHPMLSEENQHRPDALSQPGRRVRIINSMGNVACAMLGLMAALFLRLPLPLVSLVAGVTLVLVAWAIFQMLRGKPGPPTSGLIAQHEPADGAFSALPLDDRRQ